MEQLEVEIKQGEKNRIKEEKISFEIEMIINKQLYEKKLITEDMYLKVNNKLLSVIEKNNGTIVET